MRNIFWPRNLKRDLDEELKTNVKIKVEEVICGDCTQQNQNKEGESINEYDNEPSGF
jgi:hypothetical protein